MEKWDVKISIIALIIFIFIGCDSVPPKNEEKIILTTTGMLGDAAFQLVGSFAQVESLMGVGVDPHLYKATQQDIKKLQQADMIIYNGLHLEGKLQDILEKFAKLKEVHCFADKIPDSLLLKEEQNAVVDPHIWFDGVIWKEGFKELAGRFIEHFPEHSEEIKNNRDKYLELYDSKMDSFKLLIASIPKENRVLITSHDAFRYFGRTFNIEVVGLQGISTASELGIRDRLNLVEFIIQRKIPSVFIETTVSYKPMEAVIEDCKKKGHEVHLGNALLSDALGEKEKNQHTLLGMIQYNVETIVKELNR